MAIEIGTLVVGLVVLIMGGEFLVRGASNIASSFQISPLVIGLTIVAFGTSAPELLISVTSALEGEPAIAMGNVIGSNICNLSLVLGITAVFYPIVVSDNSIKIDWLMTMGSSLLLFFFMNEDYTLTRPEGIIFVCCVIVYTYFLIEMSRRETREKIAVERGTSTEEVESVTGKTMYKELGFIALGGVGLFFGADWFVGSVKVIAEMYDVPKDIIGLTVVALGTSLPELVTSAIAAYKKSTDLAIGNLLGSSIFNILTILGITSAIKSVTVTAHIMEYDMLWMLGITLLVLPMMISRKRIGRPEGIILLVAYSIYIYSLSQNADQFMNTSDDLLIEDKSTSIEYLKE